MAGVRHQFESFIRAADTRVWDAIINPDLTRQYFYDTTIESDFKSGSRYVYRDPKGRVVLQGQIVEVEPFRKLVMTFSAVHDAEMARERPSRVTWMLTPVGDGCKLNFTHDDFDGATRTYERAASDWKVVLSRLKTLLETGEPLVCRFP